MENKPDQSAVDHELVAAMEDSRDALDPMQKRTWLIERLQVLRSWGVLYKPEIQRVIATLDSIDGSYEALDIEKDDKHIVVMDEFDLPSSCRTIHKEPTYKARFIRLRVNLGNEEVYAYSEWLVPLDSTHCQLRCVFRHMLGAFAEQWVYMPIPLTYLPRHLSRWLKATQGD